MFSVNPKQLEILFIYRIFDDANDSRYNIRRDSGLLLKCHALIARPPFFFWAGFVPFVLSEATEHLVHRSVRRYASVPGIQQNTLSF